MAISLHSDKIKDEKNAFVTELYKKITKVETLTSGELDRSATRVHKLYMAIYIMNYHKSEKLKTTYFEHLLTGIIESEALIMAGFKNAAFMQLRCAMECAMKLLYFETHPIEWQLHQTNEFEKRGIEYREFFYSHPLKKKIDFILKEDVERNWSELCKYSHYDISVVKDISCIIEMDNVLENDLDKSLFKIKDTFRQMVCIFFIIDPSWLKELEKTYFDYVFESLFTAKEREELIGKLQIV